MCPLLRSQLTVTKQSIIRPGKSDIEACPSGRRWHRCLGCIKFRLLNMACPFQVICEAATGATPALRESAYECMVKIVPNYYDTLPPYMETIFSLTKHAIEKDEEEVAKQAIEFWSSICEEEIDLIDVRIVTVSAFSSL